MYRLSALSCLFIVTLLFGCTPTEEPPAVIQPDADNAGLTLPDNFGALVVADTLGRARHMAVRDNGDVYVRLRGPKNGGGTVAMRDHSGDGRADHIEYFSDTPGTGLQIHNGFLYFSSDSVVYRTSLGGDALVPTGTPEPLALVPILGGHGPKSFTVDGNGNLYVNIGSFSNNCMQEDRTAGSPGNDPCTELETRAGIWRFSDSTPNQHVSEAEHFARGIRNALALDWSDHHNGLYTVMHGRDNLHIYWPDVLTAEQGAELPSEPLYRIDEGSDIGWPYCYYDHIQNKRLLNPEYGGDGQSTERCEDSPMPLLGFPGHWAPQDLLFYEGDMFPERYRHGAFIAFHGSRARLAHDKTGFHVVFVPMQNGEVTGEYEIFADGFIGSPDAASMDDVSHRAMGLAQGPDGSLYISDSLKGRIWRVLYYPDGMPQ